MVKYRFNFIYFSMKVLRALVYISLVISIAHAKSDGIYNIEIKNHQFVPDIIRVPTGQKIRIIVKNLDDTVEEFESISLKREKIIPGKSEARLSFGPLKVGEYEFFGEFHQETAKGKIIVINEVGGE